MRRVHLIVFAALLVTGAATAQDSSCRQSWMPKEAPAFCTWRTEVSLPQARTYHSVVTSDTSIYVLGGFRFDASTNQVIYYDSVLQSFIGADGKLGPWTVDVSFNNGRSGAGAVRVGSCMFLAGGSSSTPALLTYYDDTQSARIGTDGKLSPWVLSPNHLRTPRSNHSLIAVTTDKGTFLNVVAGVAQIGNETVHLDTVEVAKVSNDCTIGEWAPANYHIKGGRSSPQALTIDNSIVAIGGWGDLDLIDVYDDIQVTTARADGTPAPWRTSPAHLPTGIYGHATTLVEAAQEPKSLLLSVGGQPGTGAYANWISYSYLKPGVSAADGIGIWRIAPTGKLPVGLAGLGVAQSGGRLYVIGGSDGNGQYHSDVLSAQFDFGQP
jgi:hypothetical protein